MRVIRMLAGLTTLVGAVVLSGATPVDPDGFSSGRSCSFANTAGLYGFECWGSYPDFQGGLQPIAAVGMVRGDGRGHFAVDATLNSNFGSLPWKLDGEATLDASRDCLGQVIYSFQELGGQVLGPAVFDFSVVAGGEEILGSATAPGATGNSVPRVACRLVHIHR
jgi:hypothetical protein